jgi:hypothetical protein
VQAVYYLAAGLMFVLSTGLFCHEKFRKNWIAVSIAGVIASASTGMFLWGFLPITQEARSTAGPALAPPNREPAAAPRQKQAADNDPKTIPYSHGMKFFGSNGAIVWYYRKPDRAIELFDKAGLHPRNGEKLLPVTNDIVKELRKPDEDAAKEDIREIERAVAECRAEAKGHPNDAHFIVIPVEATTDESHLEARNRCTQKLGSDNAVGILDRGYTYAKIRELDLQIYPDSYTPYILQISTRQEHRRDEACEAICPLVIQEAHRTGLSYYHFGVATGTNKTVRWTQNSLGPLKSRQCDPIFLFIGE